MPKKCVLCDKPATMIFEVRVILATGKNPGVVDEDGWDMCEEHANDAIDGERDTAANVFEPSDR